MAIRRRNQHHTVGHQRLQQAPQDHRIGDVGTLKLIETQELSVFSNLRRDPRHGVEVVAVLRPDLVQSFMHVLHEIVEMDARLGCDVCREGVEEEIHEHCLATPDVAVHVETLGHV